MKLRVGNFKERIIQKYSDFGKTKPMSSVKEVARQQILDLKCSVCQDVPGKLKPVRSNRNFNRVISHEISIYFS